jgi:ABC-type antimicrobial peptide transport system permease subunit
LYVPTSGPYLQGIHIHVRTLARESEMLAAIRREIQAVDSRLPVTQLRTMHDFHDRGLVLWVIRAAGRTLTGLGALALALAAIGVYGVKSYVVAQRTREIGIRLALGASPRDIVRMLLRDSARMTLVGLAIGFPLAVALGRLLSVAIFEVSPYDPVVLTLAPLVLVGAAALAAYVPARRGMRVSPLEALRVE